MPFGSEGVEPGIGLALSGGGFRATLFHCGSLWRLNELGYLSKLNRISSVSGGSITAGLLAIKWKRLEFDSGIATHLVQEVVDPLRIFCGLSIDGPAIGEGAFLPWKRISEAVEEQYQTHLYNQNTLQDLPDLPRFIFNATNFSTGVSFRFSKPYAGDYRIGLIPNPRFRVALAVTASSAFPPFLSPVFIDTDPTSFMKTEGADLYDQITYRKRLTLTDGGVYDNMGLETIWNRYQTVLISDAGAPFGADAEPDTAWHNQALRAMDVATNQARALRKRAIIADYQQRIRGGAYWGIMTEIQGYSLPDALPVPAKVTKELASIRTRLNPFSDEEQCRLINCGYAVCDAAMRRHVIQEATLPPKWPYPAYALG